MQPSSVSEQHPKQSISIQFVTRMPLEVITEGRISEDDIGQLLTDAKNDFERVDILNAEARRKRSVDPQIALLLSQRAIEYANRVTYGDGIAEALANSGRAHLILAQYEEALSEMESALSHYETVSDEAQMASLCMMVAGILFRLARHDKALEYLSKAQLIYEERGDKRGMAGVLSNIATTYQIVSQYDLALEHLLKALELQEEIGDRNGIAITANNIGGLYARLGHVETALKYVMQALSWFRDSNNYLDIIKSLCNIADMYAQLQDFEKAHYYHAEALTKARTLNDQQSVVATIISIGRLHARQRNTATALSYFATSLRLARDINDRHDEMEAIQHIGDIYRTKSEHKRALKYYLNGIDLANSIGAHSDEAVFYESASHSLEALKEFEQALLHYKKAASIRAEILAGDKEKLLSVMEIRFNIERAARDREIYRLRNVELADAIKALQEKSDALASAYADIEQQQIVTNEINLELEKANSMLLELNQDKNDLLGVVSHDIKNFIAGIKLAAEGVRRYPKTRDDEVMQATANRIIHAANDITNLIASLLDNNALETGKLSFDFEKVNISMLMAELIEHYRPTFEAKHLTLIADAQDNYFVNADRIRLKESLDNLISNSAKYSPKGKEVVIRIERVGSAIRTMVKDQGVGFTEADKKQLFQKFARLSARPTAGESSTGLGLSITKKLVEHMQGQIWLESESGKGATFFLELPEWNDELHLPTQDEAKASV